MAVKYPVLVQLSGGLYEPATSRASNASFANGHKSGRIKFSAVAYPERAIAAVASREPEKAASTPMCALQ